MEVFELYLRKYLAYIILIVIVVAVLLYIKKDQVRQLRTDGEQESRDGNGSLYYLGRGSEEDDVATLLHRISWSAYLRKRVEKWERVFIITFVVVILLMLLVWKKGDGPNGLTSVPMILATGVAIFFAVYMLENFMYIHGDIYNDANIRGNAKLVASKLGLKIDFDSDPPKPKSDAIDRVNIMA